MGISYAAETVQVLRGKKKKKKRRESTTLLRLIDQIIRAAANDYYIAPNFPTNQLIACENI